MRIHKYFWINLLTFTPSFVLVYLLFQYYFTDEEFIFTEELASAAFIGTFTAVMMYFNRYTMKGEPRGWYKSKKRGRKQ